MGDTRKHGGERRLRNKHSARSRFGETLDVLPFIFRARFSQRYLFLSAHGKGQVNEFMD
jgi:hypothetical protein